MACCGSFLCCCGENHPYPKSGLDLDPDKPGCTTFFASFFADFCPRFE